MKIRLSDHFTFRKLLRFTFPSMMMMVFVSIYGVVDGLFISNCVGKTAFAAVNIVMPFIMMIGGIGAMLGTGGSALVAKTLGEGDHDRAHRYFTMMIQVMVLVGVFFSIVGMVFIRPVSIFLGADEALLPDCVLYGRTALAFNAALLMQYTFQSFLITAEKPKLGLWVTILAGGTNIVLDALFMVVFPWGVMGAALATGLSECVGGVIPLCYFLSKRNQTSLRFVRTRWEVWSICKACGNGASEMMSTISASITGILYNRQLMAYAGEDGVAAYGVIMYASFLFIGIFTGFSNGSAPIVGYHYGAKNHAELKNILRKSLTFVLFAGGVMMVSGSALAEPLANIFVGYDRGLTQMTIHALRICFVAFLIIGVNVYASSFFTALNNGSVSAAISFLRSLLLPVVTIIILPILFGLDGIWYSLPAGEALALFVSVAFLMTNRKKYQY
ncbi:MAG: MATE family efflux transporter [Planctomycetia bacterium]|nr:MATE family efflux transporter [Planctomycetia bacterium]